MVEDSKVRNLIGEHTMGVITDSEFYHKFMTILAGKETKILGMEVSRLPEEQKLIVEAELDKNCPSWRKSWI